MFALGDKIMYGTEGVYIVSEYADSPIDKNDDRRFYVLKPAHGPQGNLIYTPVDNDKVNMRPVMSKDEALAFIDGISSIPVLEVEKEKSRREIYRLTMQNADCKEYVSIIKTVHQRREELTKLKKRLSEADADYEKKAKYCLYGELSIALDIPVDEVEKFIIDRLDM